MPAALAEGSGADRFALPRAVLVAVVLEVLLVLGVAVSLPTRLPPKLEVLPVTLSFPTLPDPPAKPAPAPDPLPTPRRDPPPPKPMRPRIARQHVSRHPAETTPAPIAEPPAQLAAVPVAAEMPAENMLPAPAPPVAAPPAPPRIDPSVRASFEDRVRAAVQASVRYPYAGRLAHLSGRAQVAFVYLDAKVSGVRLATSSGSDLLDAAALQAVSAAQFPSPPATLAGKRLAFEIWVRFTLSDAAD